MSSDAANTYRVEKKEGKGCKGVEMWEVVRLGYFGMGGDVVNGEREDQGPLYVYSVYRERGMVRTRWCGVMCVCGVCGLGGKQTTHRMSWLWIKAVYIFNNGCLV